jgi:hypothetical protein
MTGLVAASANYEFTVPVTIQLSDRTIRDTAIGTAVAVYRVQSDGRISDGTSTLESWLVGAGTNSDYEVMATVTSGTLSSGTTGSWLNCGTTQTWSKINNDSNNSVQTAVIGVSIRRASDSTVMDSATITLSAESDNLN